MSNFGSLRDRRGKFNFLGGRALAVAVITAVAALSFTLGFYAGRSGQGAQNPGGAVQVVPEGAGLVLLGGDNACSDSVATSTSGTSSNTQSDKSSKTAGGPILETMKIARAPEPDPDMKSAGPEEPVLEPIYPKTSETKPKAASKPGEKPERRVAPIRQLPSEEESAASPAGTSAREDSGRSAPEPVAHLEEKHMEEKPAEAPKPRRVEPSRKRTPSTKQAATEKEPSQSRPAVSEGGHTYSVQVGAFKSLGDAQTHKLRFTKKGYKASVYKDGSGAGSIFKVRVGLFQNRAEADSMARKLQEVEGVSAFVTTID